MKEIKRKPIQVEEMSLESRKQNLIWALSLNNAFFPHQYNISEAPDGFNINMKGVTAITIDKLDLLKFALKQEKFEVRMIRTKAGKLVIMVEDNGL